MKKTLIGFSLLTLFAGFANADVIYERDPKAVKAAEKLAKPGTFHSGIGECPGNVVEDERLPENAVQLRVTIDEQGRDGHLRVIHHVSAKSVSDGLTNPVVWKNNGVTKNLKVVYPVLKDRTEDTTRETYAVCSFGQAYLTAKEAQDGKYNVTFRMNDKTVSGIIPVSDAKSGSFAELPIYSVETLTKTVPLSTGDRATVSWHAPETGLVRHATIERIR